MNTIPWKEILDTVKFLGWIILACAGLSFLGTIVKCWHK
jgi:hypothetical protein